MPPTYPQIEKMAERHASDERVVKARMPDGSFTEAVAYQIDEPVGRVSVELRDAINGRLQHAETKQNFIAKQWAICARSFQRFAWGSVVGGVPTTKDGDLPFMQPTGPSVYAFPNQWIAAWNDGSAIDPATEHRMRIPGESCTAVAHIVPFGTQADQRGMANVVETTMTRSLHRQVFDWTTSAGNGTFQSIGWTHCVTDGNTAGLQDKGLVFVRPSIDDRRYGVVNGQVLTAASGAIFPANYVVGTTRGVSAGAVGRHAFFPGLNAAGDYVFFGKLSSGTTTAFIMVTIPAAQVSGGWAPVHGNHIKTITPTVSSAGSWTGANTGSTTNLFMAMLGEYASHYWVLSWSTTASNFVLGRLNPSTLVIDRNANIPAGSSQAAPSSGSGCIIGSNAYIAQAGDDATIARMDLNANPPVQTATITLTHPATLTTAASRRILDITTDGTDLYVMFQGTGNTAGRIYKYNTSGNLLEHIGAYVPDQYTAGSVNYTFPSTQSVALNALSVLEPLNGASNTATQGMSRRAVNPGALVAGNYVGVGTLVQNDTSLGLDTTQYGSGAGGILGTGLAGGHGILWINGKLCGVGRPTAGGTTGVMLLAYSEIGYNLGSRVLLDSPVTKTSAQTMKIAYETSFADMVTGL